MLRLEDANESFVREDYTAPAIEANKVPARYLTELELHFPPHVAHRVYDEFDEGAVEEDESGWLRVCARMPNDAWLKGFLDSFGADINIIRHEPIPPLNEDL